MPVLTSDDLNDFAGGPDWSEEDVLTVERTIAGVVRQLGNRLNTFVGRGEERFEHALVSPTIGHRPGGLMCTGHPIFEILEIDGVPVPPRAGVGDVDDLGQRQPAPAGWQWAGRGRLRALRWDTPVAAYVPIRYHAGLEVTEEIRAAVRRKAHALTANRTDDTVVARGTDIAPPPLLSEEWSDAELGDLKVLYNIGIRR